MIRGPGFLGADGGWCRRRSSKPFRGADGVPGGFDSHTLPSPPAAAPATELFGPVRTLVHAVTLAALLGLGGLAGAGSLAAQEGDPPPGVDPPADTAAVPDSLPADSAVSPVVREEPAAPAEDERPSGPAPMSAFLRSVLIPGWGQLAADQPVRGAVYFALQSATVYMVIRTNKRIGEAEGEGLKDARREQREDWLVLAGFWALASGIDAWVSAQMWGFEGEVVPPPEGTAGLAVRMRVPIAGF